MDLSQKQEYMKELLASLADRFMNTYEQLTSPDSNEEEIELLKDYLANIISYCS